MSASPAASTSQQSVTEPHPKGLYLLFAVEMWERFSYYGMKAILILYLVSPLFAANGVLADNPGRGWSKSAGSILLGWYGGMAYLLPVIGGIIADRWIGTHRSMIVGGLLIAMGHIALGCTGFGDLRSTHLGMSVFIFGLALVAIGTGHFKPSVSVMVGQLYRPEDKRRDAGFAIYYMGINIGAFLGQLACGYFGEKVAWHWGFGAAAIGMLAGLAAYVVVRPHVLAGIGEAPEGRGKSAFLFLPIGLVLAGFFAFLYYIRFWDNVSATVSDFFAKSPTAAQLLVPGLALIMFVLVAWFVAIQKPGDRGPTAAIFIVVGFATLFWLAFEQSSTSLNLFAKDNTDRMIGGWEAPAAWLQNVNPIFIILMSPLFALLWGYLGRRDRNPSQPMRMAWSLLLLGLAYVFMTIGGAHAATGAKVSMFWLVAAYFWMTAGELCMSPTGLSFITKAAPIRFVSLLMGVWFVAVFIADLGGGYVASTVEDVESGKLSLFWYQWFRLGGQGDYFLLFVISSFAAGILILILTPLVKKILHGRG